MANIAESSGKLFLPKTADAIFEVGGVVAFIAKANTSANVNITTTQSQVRGGKNNSVIGIITSEKAVEVSFSTPEWQPEFLAANVGTKIKYGEQNFILDNLTYTVDNAQSITLEEIPVDKVIQIEVNGKWTSVPATTEKINLAAYGFAENDCVSVIGVFPREGLEISLTTDTDPTVGKLTLTSPIYRGTQGEVGDAQYEFPSFALSGNWTQAFSSDASYEISGTPIAVAGVKCGEGETYGYYRQHIKSDESLNQFVSITATPSEIELTVGDTEQILVYGTRGALSEKTEITGKAAFALDGGDTSVISVSDTGLITANGKGTANVLVTYGDSNLTATVTVTVESA